MTYERLTSTDAAFLHIETPHEPQHVGSLTYLEGGPLRDGSGRIRIEELRGVVAARLHRVPRLRQRVMFVPYGQGRPVWVDDDRFDLDYHIRLTALPRPGGDHELHDLFGRLQSLPLDRSRPLWEMWFVDGLADDQVGLAMKSHHAMGDGIANIDLVMAMVDLEPAPAPDPPPPSWSPRPPPSPDRLLVDSIAEQLRRPADLALSAVGALRHPRQAFDTIGDALGALLQFRSHPAPAPWNAPVTPHRRWVAADVDLADVRRIRERTRATINDVVLEACTSALRGYLLAHDEDVAGRSLRAMVPVSRRTDAEHGNAALGNPTLGNPTLGNPTLGNPTLGNQVSLIVADLPIGEPDAEVRLAAIHEQTDVLKGSGLADGVETMLTAAGELTLLAAPLARLLSRAIPMNLVITNIPGPPVPLYVHGARVLRAHPYVEIIDNEGLTIAVVSYDDHLYFGLTADRDAMPDLHLVAEGIEQAVHHLADPVART